MGGNFKQVKFRANNARQTREVIVVVIRDNWDVIERLLAIYCSSLLLTFAGNTHKLLYLTENCHASDLCNCLKISF